jgi:hypothetical protein
MKSLPVLHRDNEITIILKGNSEEYTGKIVLVSKDNSIWFESFGKNCFVDAEDIALLGIRKAPTCA